MYYTCGFDKLLCGYPPGLAAAAAAAAALVGLVALVTGSTAGREREKPHVTSTSSESQGGRSLLSTKGQI